MRTLPPLLLVTLASVLLMSVRLGDPIGGYLAFNEAFYFSRALEDAGRGILDPVVAPLDANNPFVYPLLLSLVVRLFGESVAAARALSVAATAATILLTYALARRLFTPGVALRAAALLAFTPGFLLVGRNLQIDPLMLALEMAVACAYLRAVEEDSPRRAAAAGLLAGIGLLTKLPSLLALPALALWRTWSTGGLGWIRARTTGAALAAFAATAVPWYAYRFATSARFAASQAYLAGIAVRPTVASVTGSVLAEIAWMLMPLAAFAAAGCLLAMSARPGPAEKFVLSFVGVHAGVYLFYHYHSYYFLPLAPFAAIALGRGFARLDERRPAAGGAVARVALLALALSSVALLAEKKFTQLRIDRIGERLAAAGLDPRRVTLAASDRLYRAYDPVIAYYARKAGIPRFVRYPLVPGTEPAPGTTLVVLAGDEESGAPPGRFLGPLPLRRVVPVLFGHAVLNTDWNESFFRCRYGLPGRVLAGWPCGLLETDVTMKEAGLYLVPAGNGTP